jgi:hypothetical protein
VKSTYTFNLANARFFHTGQKLKNLTMQEAKAFISNKKGCSIHEYLLDDLLGECLI